MDPHMPFSFQSCLIFSDFSQSCLNQFFVQGLSVSIGSYGADQAKFQLAPRQNPGIWPSLLIQTTNIHVLGWTTDH